MTSFESEIQKLLYEILVGDTALLGFLGGNGSDLRIYLSFSDFEAPSITIQSPAYIVIESMPASTPVQLSSGIDDWKESYCLHLFNRPEDRALRYAAEERFRELFHRRNFVTDRFIVYQVFEDGREGVLTESGLFDYRYTISFGFIYK